MDTKLVASEAVINFGTRTFRLTRDGKSGFKKDGTGENGRPAEYLTHGKFLSLEPISRLFLGAGKGYRKTQYVVGASTIYEEDYYEDGDGKLVLDKLSADQAKEKGYQFRPGLKSQGYNLREEYATSMGLNLGFENGEMRINDDPMLLKFLEEHEQNEEAPRAKENKDPRRLRLFMFKAFVKEQSAAKSKPVQNFDADFEALKYVDSLRKKNNDGYSYNEDKLDATMAILEEGQGLGAGEVAQKFMIAATYAKKDGTTFMGAIDGTLEEYRKAINIATELKVLSIGAKEVKMSEEGAKASSIYTLKEEGSKDNAIIELTNYFLGKAQGRHDYSEMIRLTERAKISALAK